MARRNKSDGGVIWAIIIGIPVFLLVVHPLIFWLVFVPLVVIGITKFITWLKK